MNKQIRAAEIKAELATLRERLVELKTDDTESEQLEKEPPPYYIDKTIDDANNERIFTTAALTKTTRRLIPSTMTTITYKDIKRSQARSLYELLEMYVPNLQMLFTSEHPKTMGVRGIIAHRSDKFLVMVNGRIMNERTDVGAMTELDLPMMTDIHHIDVIRGPSAALYGTRALSMVINIVTHNARTFQGQEFAVSGGQIEKFMTFEYKVGRKLKDDAGMFFSAGASQYGGAKGSDSPTVLGTDSPFWLRSGRSGSYIWTPYREGDKIEDWFKNLNETPFERMKMKMYAEYNKGGFTIWGRYTQGGQWIDFTRWLDTWLGERQTSDEGLSYNQAVIQAKYEHQPFDNLTIEYSAGYEWFANENENYDKAFFWKSFAEDEIYAKVLARWTPRENHSFAFGGEWAHDEFGKRFADTAVSIQPFGKFQDWGRLIAPEYEVERIGLFGEYQWNINKKVTLFLGGRADWHPYTETLFSPRGVIVYTPNKKDTFKFMVARSFHTNTEGQIWIDNHLFGIKSPAEQLDSFELRYERQHNNNLWLAGSIFLHRTRDALGENPDDGVASGGTSSKKIGKVDSYGFELEAGYRKGKLNLNFSHSFTKLLNMSSPAPGVIWNQYSSEPFGFGDDFAQWHNHTSKLRAEYKFNDKLTLNGALVVLWGNPGGQDWANYRHSLYAGDYAPGFDEPFDPSAYLNLGLEYKWNKNTTIHLTGYNLLGIIDEELNKRRVGFDDQLPGHYRIQPAAFGASLTHRF